MSDAVIARIAEAIFNHQEAQYLFLGLTVALAFLSSAFGAYVGAYLSKRAETRAIQTDLNVIIEQGNRTTRAAENIRTEIAHTDWAQREWKATRKVKIEELLSAVFSVQAWIYKAEDYYLFDATDRPPPRDALNAVKVLGLLFFPEIAIEIERFLSRSLAYQGNLLETHTQMLKTPASKQAIYDASKDARELLYADVLAAVHELEDATADLMPRIVGSPIDRD